MSLRLRLTLLYSAILALTLIAFSVALYLTVAQVTYNVLKETLEAEAKRLKEARGFQLDSISYQARKFATPETFVQTRALDGRVIARAHLLAEITLPLSDEALRTLQHGLPLVEIQPIENQRLMIYNVPVTDDRRTSGIIQVARSLADQDEALDTLRQILIIGSSVIPLVAFGVGWVLAGAALRPITRITQTAQAIGVEQDFSRRVAYSGPNDEVGRLATTFNTMLTELQVAYQRVEQALQAQRRFVADASHELRTPLTTLRGNIGLLQREPPISDEDRRAVLNDMLDECERLTRLVNDLLTLARADAGRPLRSEPVLLKPLIEDICRKAQQLDPGRRMTCSDLLDVAVLGDVDAIRQIVLILLDNALKFTPPEGAIRVTVTRGDGHIAVHVDDTGIGIAPTILPHIFERFYRGDAARTGSGAGLGLAIARALVEELHGTITVESAVGKGSRFTVRLPEIAMP